MGSGFIEQDQVFCSDCTASAGEQSNRHCCVRINTIMDPRQKHSGMTRQKSQTGLTGKSRQPGCRTNDQSNRHSCIRHSCVFLTGILAGIHSTVAEEQGLLGASMRLAPTGRAVARSISHCSGRTGAVEHMDVRERSPGTKLEYFGSNEGSLLNPQLIIEKGLTRRPFSIMWLGNKDYSAHPCASPSRFAALILVRSWRTSRT
jgi:hypothetical protein